jgi:uncharacterized protein (DUF433 family)
MDWLKCSAIEAIPGKMGGRPVIKGTRIEPETIVDSFELGSSVEEIHEDFPTVPVDIIQKLLLFAHAEQPVP